MAEAQALQARMQRHMARNQAMTEAMQAAAQQVGRLPGRLLACFAQTKPRSARCQPWLPPHTVRCRRRLWRVCSPATR